MGIIREEFGPLLDGTDLSLLAVVGGMGIGRVTVTPEGGKPGADLTPPAGSEPAAGRQQRRAVFRAGAPLCEMVERLCESAVTVGQEVIEAAKNEPRWRDVAKQMVHAWNEGTASLRDPQVVGAVAGQCSRIQAQGEWMADARLKIFRQRAGLAGQVPRAAPAISDGALKATPGASVVYRYPRK